MSEPMTLQLEKFCGDLGLEIVFAGRRYVTLSSYSVTRPGLQFSGFFKSFDSRRIIVLGNSEYDYLREMPHELRCERMRELFSHRDIPCVILARDLPGVPEMLEQARMTGCPILRTAKLTSRIINDLFIYLNNMLAQNVTVHGVLMDVSGVGILLTGHSGVGKSETAMELIKRGHRLVADDSVVIRHVLGRLYGSSPEEIRYFMEIRGIGIINIKNMYGSGAILDEKELDLVLELEDWVDGKEYDRLGTETVYENILGVDIMKHVIPIKPGRNLSIIIEVAARHYRLKQMGYDAAEELIRRTADR